MRHLIDMESGAVLDAAPLGSVVHFGSGGGGGGNVDYAYNKRMAAIAEEQMAMSKELFSFWEESYRELESAQIYANLELIPYQVQSEIMRMMAQEEIGPHQMEELIAKHNLGAAEAKAAMSLLDQQTELGREEMHLRMGEIQMQKGLLGDIGETQRMGLETQRAQYGLEQERIGTARENVRPIMTEFYKEALSGIDPDKRASEAQAGVRHSFAQQEKIDERNLARRGVTPSSGVAMQTSAGRGIEQAKAVAGAGTLARSEAEREKFDRLKSATTSFGLGG